MHCSKKHERFGLIGNPLGHSLSPEIHEAIFRALNLDAEYKLYQLEPGELAEGVPALMEALDGFNCTIPYKRELFSYLDALDPDAAQYESVNTVYRRCGYNTDAAGFMAAGFDYRNSSVLVLGSGGVSHTMVHCAARAGAAEIIVLTRQPYKTSLWLQELAVLYPKCTFYAVADAYRVKKNVNYILNGTPLGMWPDSGALPLDPFCYRQFLASPELRAVFDAIYNPVATRFILMARSRGIRAVSGLHMLFHQALEAEKIWHPDLAESFGQEDVVRKLRVAEEGLALYLAQKFPMKIILTGFMGCGKSTTGRLLAESLGKKWRYLDLDEVIAGRLGKSIAQIFMQEGEAAFRRYEQEALAEVLSHAGPLILSAGGGTLLTEAAETMAKSLGGMLVFLSTSLETSLSRTSGGTQRPLLMQSDDTVRELYDNRRPRYLEAADLVIDAEQDPETCARDIIRQIFNG